MQAISKAYAFPSIRICDVNYNDINDNDTDNGSIAWEDEDNLQARHFDIDEHGDV